MAAEISYDELSSNLGETVVIDVRDHKELQEHGKIPGSHCIPKLGNALDMDDDDFESKYGFKKPSSDTAVVTHCMKGGRAKKAFDLLNAKGFNARLYAGSFNDWKARGGSVDHVN